MSDLKERVLARLANDPQKQGLAEVLLKQLDDAVAAFAGLGLALRVTDEVLPQAVVEYPKFLFGTKSGQEPLIVESEREEADARALGYVGALDAEPSAQPTEEHN
jgi:hypothetical protein